MPDAAYIPFPYPRVAHFLTFVRRVPALRSDMVEWLTLMIFASFTVVPIVLTVWLLMCASQATTWVGRCRRCGYDLYHLGDRRECPECGQPFQLNSRGDPIS